MEKMTRISLRPEDLGTPTSRRDKDANQTEDVEVLEDSEVNEGDLAGSDERRSSGTSTELTPLSKQRRESGDSKESHAKEAISRTQETEDGKRTLKRRRARSSFVPTLEPLPKNWLKLPIPTSNNSSFKDIWARPQAPAASLEIALEADYLARQRRCKRTTKKLAPKPRFQIFRDSTADITNITELHDEYFGEASRQAHDWVECYCQNAAFDLSIIIVGWVLSVCENAGKGYTEKDGATLEKRLSQWKEDIEWERHAAVLTKRAERGCVWFKSECVEGLADLFEEAMKDMDKKVGEIGFDADEDFFQIEYMVIKVCGYCQAQGLYGRKRPTQILWNGGDEDHYERSGHAWKRIVDYFEGDLWERCRQNVEGWHWHDLMMQRVLRKKNRIKHIDLLRSRWAVDSNHPLAPIRKTLEDVSGTTINALQRDEEDEGYLEDGV